MKLPQLLDYIEEFILLLSKDGSISYINETALSLYGWRENHIIGKNFLKILETEGLPSPLPQNFSFDFAQPEDGNSETFFSTSPPKVVSWRWLPYKWDL